MKVRVERNIFKCSLEPFVENDIRIMVRKGLSVRTSAIYAKSVESFNMKENVFSLCTGADKGGVIRLDSSNLIDYYSEFYSKTPMY
jgi:hypothetical protein